MRCPTKQGKYSVYSLFHGGDTMNFFQTRGVAGLAATVLATVLASCSLATTPSQVTAVLRLKGKVSLQDLAASVRDPSSPRFGIPYSPAEIKALSGPSDEDYNQFVTQLTSEGFQIAAQSPTHLWVSVKGPSSLFDQVFGSNIQNVATQGQSGAGPLRTNLSRVSPPARLNLVESVTGLDNTRRSKPRYIQRGKLTATPGGVPQATIKTAYGFDPIYQQGLSGKGQDIE